jgi:N6-L-threonylcarbamoyladenine synthase
VPSAYILGIESSCDETAAAVVRSGEQLISNVVASQIATHQPYGGVVPELASREHLKAIVPVVRQALAEANQTYRSVDAIAVTQGPGLAGALLVGISYAKALAFALDKPLIAVNHLEGHIHAVLLEERQKGNHELQFPVLALVVSGGHTHLYLAAQKNDSWTYENVGHTRDDAAGEAFDKVGKLLGLPYPGGRHVERLAAGGDPSRVRFTRPMLRRDQRLGDDDYYDVSFSGLKTAVRLALATTPPHAPADVARGFQDALIGTLVEKTARAVEAYGRQRVILGGGVAGNRSLVEAMRTRVATLGAAVYSPSPRLATDNAAMIARAGLFRFSRGETAGPDLTATATAPIPGLIAA